MKKVGEHSVQKLGEGAGGEAKTQKNPTATGHKAVKKIDNMQFETAISSKRSIKYFNRFIREVNKLGIQDRILPPLYLKQGKHVADLGPGMRLDEFMQDHKIFPQKAAKQYLADLYQLHQNGFLLTDPQLHNFIYNQDDDCLIRFDLDMDSIHIDSDNIQTEKIQNNIVFRFIYEIGKAVGSLNGIIKAKYLDLDGCLKPDAISKDRNYADLMV